MPTPITPPFLPGLGLMASSRRQAGLDQPDEMMLPRPALPPAPRNPFVPQPLGPQKDAGLLTGRSNLALGHDQPMLLGDGPTMPSGFDPRAQTPYKAEFNPGRPANDLESVLGGLRGAAPHPLIQMARMSQLAGPGENPAWGQQRQQFIDQQLAPQRASQKPIEDALTAQHPAIQGLKQLEAEQKALPQELEAAGRIQAAKRTAEGLVGRGQVDADSRQRSSIIGLLGPLLEQITKAREQTSLDATDPDLQGFAGRNEQHEAALNALMQLFMSRPEFEF